MNDQEGDHEKMTNLDEEKLQDLYAWIDEVPLSRVKRNVGRDFSDGVLVAEVIHHYIPRLVDLHNYSPASSSRQKQENWGTLNRKVLNKLHFSVPEHLVRSIIISKPGVVEEVLWQLRHKIDLYLNKKRGVPAKISPDGYLDGNEVGSLTTKSHRGEKIGMGKAPKPVQAAPKAPTVLRQPPGNISDSKGMSYRQHQHMNGNLEPELPPAVRMLVEQKEQALLASQETVQILQAKVRRLEHLLKLKDDRIEELAKRVNQKLGSY